MWKKWLSKIYYLSFGLLVLTVLYATRKPLCIESRVVEKIDRWTSKGIETAYRCSLSKAVPYSQWMQDNLDQLSRRLQETERVLENMQAFHKRLNLVVLSDRPNVFRFQGDTLYIGEAVLKNEGHLERGLIKAWYREKNQNLFFTQRLVEESFADLILYMQKGELQIGDPIGANSIDLSEIRWPQIIKVPEEYCESVWRMSEHTSLCHNLTLSHKTEISSEIAELALRPLVSTAMIKAYSDLSLKDRYRFSKLVPRILSDADLGKDLVGVDPNRYMGVTALTQASTSLRQFHRYLTEAELFKSSTLFRDFVALLANQLKQTGYEDAFAEANFDLVFSTKKTLDGNSSEVASFRDLAKKHPNLQIAIHDSQNLWMMPSKFPVPLSAFGKVKANRMIVETCGPFDFNFVLGFARQTEKLLIVDDCDSKRLKFYSAYISDGAEGFGEQNKGVAFVQFHLPSLAMKKASLGKVQNVFDLISRRELSNPVFQSLGWQEVKYSTSAEAYYPKAFVDAIEWFRTPDLKLIR